MTPEIYYRIKQIPRIIRFLHVHLLSRQNMAGTGSSIDQGAISPDSYVTEIRYDEIRRILELLDDQDNIGLSRVFVTNSKVSVIDGPLKGLEGIIKKINKRTSRAKIQISFLGNDHFVDVGIEVLQPTGGFT
jgi:transcriptional antiterminator NusG